MSTGMSFRTRKVRPPWLITARVTWMRSSGKSRIWRSSNSCSGMTAVASVTTSGRSAASITRRGFSCTVTLVTSAVPPDRPMARSPEMSLPASENDPLAVPPLAATSPRSSVSTTIPSRPRSTSVSCNPLSGMGSPLVSAISNPPSLMTTDCTLSSGIPTCWSISTAGISGTAPSGSSSPSRVPRDMSISGSVCPGRLMSPMGVWKVFAVGVTRSRLPTVSRSTKSALKSRVIKPSSFRNR